MKSAIIIFPGSNCNNELQFALETVRSKIVNIWHKETVLPGNIDVVFLPGGFSFGDYLRPGAIAATSPILKAVVSFAKKGGYIVGICNGFQILLESQLLPGTLLRNKGQNFLCKDENLIVQNSNSVFTSNFVHGEVINFPIAHNDGNFYCSDDDLKMLIQSERIPFYYSHNSNGSKGDVAAVFSSNKRVLGLMPHPERVVLEENGGTDGLRFFSSIAGYL